ncbi:MAG TPA: cellulose binding domain-containing protein [Pseudobacteroides sp.]|uniref:anti-sigma-I factor RsgI family protein n=1 Tax=Pseudobacteroides sp. TaxID=1968840 RepID=UPI002F932115
MINIGTIMEVYKNQVLVMTMDFELVYVERTPEMYLGQQITFGKSQVVRPKKSYLFVASGIAATLVLAIICVFILKNIDLNRDNTFYAFIDMDINPSIEFLIDERNHVKKVLPLNSDGERMIKDLSLGKLPVKEAVEKVIEASQKTGIMNINKNDVIMISASLNQENSDYKEKKDDVEQKLNQLLNSLKEINNTVFSRKYKIKAIKVEPGIKKQATKNGLSGGRQFILEKAHSIGIDLSVNEAKSDSLSLLMKRVGIDEQNIDNLPFNSLTAKETGKPASSLKPTSRETVSVIVTPGNRTTYARMMPGNENVRDNFIDGKETYGIIPTDKKMTATPERISKSTPRPAAQSIKPSEAKKPDLSAGSIKIQYYNATQETGNVIQLGTVFSVVNTGNTIINLKDVTIRYYYTIDGEKNQSLDCWAQEDKANITYRFVKMSKPAEKADYYVEIGFKSGQLNPGKNTVVVTWFNKEDWSTYKYDNDYSRNSPKVQELYDWKYVTGYISGVLKWGIEPED